MALDYFFGSLILAALLLWIRYDLFANINHKSNLGLLRTFFFIVRIIFVSFAFISLQWLIFSSSLKPAETAPQPQIIQIRQQVPPQPQQEDDSELKVDILQGSEIETRFENVAGLQEVKTEIQEMVDFFQNPEKFRKIGATMPKGILLHGPTGTGKTLLARALAGEAGVSFISVSGSAFDEKWVGLGAKRVRELFKLGRENKPCIIFIDEIDALAPARGSISDSSGQVQTVNQLLAEMDNIDEKLNEGIFIMGATNRLDSVDTAILRPGRFDRKVYVRLPNLAEREDILKLYINNIKASDELNIKEIAGTTPGFSGADLKNLVNEAAINAARTGKDKVTKADIEYAKDKITLGMEVKTAMVPLEERRNTAYHEAGHAIVGIMSPNFTLKFNKVTIGLRNQTLGVTHFEIQDEGYSVTRGFLEDKIATAYGGRAAEELVFGRDKVTSGAHGDMKTATKIAREMVVSYGLSDLSNVVSFETLKNVPNDKIFKEIENILKRGHAKALKILTQNRKALDALANELLKKETLDYHEVMEILKKYPPQKTASGNMPVALAEPFE